MQEIELEIDRKYWVAIVGVGVILGALLSVIIYLITGYSYEDGIEFGILLGASITSLAVVFTSVANRYILPHLPKVLWMPIAAGFSFIAGFGGTHVTTYIALHTGVVMIPSYLEHYYLISFFIGFITYIMGLLMWLFVKMNNLNNYNKELLMDSRLKSLERQLNPHFLFNALNSLAELIYQDHQKAEQMTLKLSSFLRSSMREEAIITLKDEISNLREYVELENIRFNHQIELVISSFESYEQYQLPKFSVQLIVENAIKHGYQNRSRELKIEIDFKEDAKGLRIIISNTGESVEDATFGIGLTNLNQRLELLCGGEVELIDAKITTYQITLGDCHENRRR
jgi:two-component system LytT family sensor kinase